MKHWTYLIFGPTNKIYVGITRNPKGRWGDHRKCKDDRPLYRDMKKYGKDTFSFHLIAEHDSLEEAKNSEIRTIKLLGSQVSNIGYNLTEGGDLDGAIGAAARNARLQTDKEFYEIYSLTCQRTVTEVWKNRSTEEKDIIFSKISKTLKNRIKTEPDFAEIQKQRMLAARAKGDVAKRGLAASTGLKKFWIELRKDPEKYDEYIRTRKNTLLLTLKEKAKC